MLLDGDEVSWLMGMIVDGGVLRSIGCAVEYGCGTDWVGVVGKM